MKFIAKFIILFSISANAQLGCTDVVANNYSAAATQNNGSCTYAVSQQSYQLIGSLSPTVLETSGLIYDGGYIWSHNDSGNAAKFFKINPSNGAILQTITITNHNNDDWEDIASDVDNFYIGDFGNNNGTRTNLKVLKISKSQFINNATSTVSVTSEEINFSYTDQTNFSSNAQNNFDCEALISVGNFLYLFTKNRGDLHSKLYKLPKTAGTYSLTQTAIYNTAGLITGADYNATLNEVALIGYMPPLAKNSFLFYLYDFVNDDFFSGNVRRVEIGDSNNIWQTEGIAYKNNNELFVSSESNAPVSAKLFVTNKNSNSLNLKLLDDTVFKIYPNPSSDFIHIDSKLTIQNIKITALEGKTVFCKNDINEQSYFIRTQDFTNSDGCFFIAVQFANGQFFSTKIIVNK